MRLIHSLILILLMISLSASAQQLNFANKKITLAKFFKDLRKQTGYNVVWYENELDADQIIDVNFKNNDLKAVLEYVLRPLSLSYSFTGKTIIVKRTQVKAPEIKINKSDLVNLHGIVVNEHSQPLEGATVMSKEGNKIAVTNKKGEYALRANKKDVLIVSFLGYETKTIKITDHVAVIELVLNIDNLKEVEIVSTGYQNIPKQRATGSFVLVDSAQLQRRVSSDIFSRLEGITSGLLFNKNTVSTNAGNLDLSIRGRSTIFANDQPLIILDNFPFIGDFNSINPNDIENITVLKDAASASIWGVRAGNGVIVIKTKRGKYNQPLNISLNTNLTVSAKPDVFYNPNYLSSSDFIDIETFLFKNGKYDEALNDQVNYPVVSPVVQILNKQRMGASDQETEQQLAALRGNDIRREELKYFYRNPVSQQYAVSLSGGTAKSNHYFSAGYDKALSSLVKNDNDRLTINSQNAIKLAKNLELTAGAYFARSTATVDSTINGTSGVNFIPYYQFKDANGNPTVFDMGYSAEYKQAALDRGFLDWNYVPLNELGRSPLLNKSDDLRLSTGLKYTFLPGLSAEVKYQYQLIDAKSDLYNGIEIYQTRNLINQFSVLTSGQVTGYNIPLGGIRYAAKSKSKSNSLRFQLNYQKNWQKHEVSAIAGYEISESLADLNRRIYYGYDERSGKFSEVDTASFFNLNPSGFSSIGKNSEVFGTVSRIRSSFVNIAYTYDNRYTISGSARMDGSNYFGVKTNQKQVPLWSLGGLWNLDREEFYNISWLSTLKLRASYGYNGNLDKTNTGITTFKYNDIGATYTNLPFAVILNIGNPELRWEKVGIANFGVDFSSKGQILTGKIEYYFKRGSDILGDKSFPSNSGISTLKGNYSKMSGEGVDISLTSLNLNGKLKWRTNFLFSTAHDRVTEYDVIDMNSNFYVGRYNNKPVLGKPVYGVYSYRWAGLDPLNGDPQGYLDGELSKNYSAIMNNTKLKDLEYNGPARPTIFGGLNNSFSLHRFTFSFNIIYKMGYYFRKSSVNYYSMNTTGLGRNMNNDFSKRWQKSGDELITDVPSITNNFDDAFRDGFYNNSSATIARGDHIRLQDISLSFDLNRFSWRRMPVKQIQLYFYANNLGILWKANDLGLDPDLIPETVERLSSPAPRSFSIGLKANF